MAISATTTINSMSVNPDERIVERPIRRRARRFDAHRRTSRGARRVLISLPRSDVGILALAAENAICSEAVDVDLTFQAGIGILVRSTPRVVGQLIEVRLPVLRDGTRGRFDDERLQALV